MPDIHLLALLALACYAVVHGVENLIDLPFNDEPYYINYALALPDALQSLSQRGPLYLLWYKLLSLAQPNNIDLYYLNYKLLSVLPPLLVYVFLRAADVGKTMSFLIAVLFLTSAGNFPLDVKVSHFNIMTLTCGMATLAVCERTSTRFFIGAMTCLFASLVRPEMYLAFIAFSALFAGRLIYTVARAKDRRVWTSDFAKLVAGVLCAATLLSIFGLPMKSPTHGRAFVTFEDHFARAWAIRNNVGLSPTLNREVVFRANFGSADTIFAALRENPGEFLAHVQFNMSLALPFGRAAHLLPANRDYPLAYYTALSLVLIALAAHGRRARSRRGAKAALAAALSRVKNNHVFLICAGVLIAPSVVSMFVIYPRDHYFIIVLAVMILAASKVALARAGVGATHGFAPNPRRLAMAAPALVLAIVFIESRGIADADRPRLATARFIQSLGLEGKKHAFLSYDDFGLYMRPRLRFHRLRHTRQWKGIQRELADKKIRVILVSPRLTNHPFLADDPAWRALLDNPGKSGFADLEIPTTRWRLLLSEDIYRDEGEYRDGEMRGAWRARKGD